MPAASFLGYLKAMIKRENAVYMQDVKKQAHLGWQIRTAIQSITGGEIPSYMEYLDMFGLLDEDEKLYMKFAKQREKEQAKVEAKQNIEKAQAIVDAIRGPKAK